MATTQHDDDMTKDVRQQHFSSVSCLSYPFLHPTEEDNESVCAEIGQLARQCKFFFVGGSFVSARENCSWFSYHKFIYLGGNCQGTGRITNVSKNGVENAHYS